MRELRFKNFRWLRLSLAAVGLVFGLVVSPGRAPQAQRGGSDAPVNVTGVTTRQRGQDAVVSIAGDGALSRAQTWQDDEGFHIVVYKGQNALRSGLPRGVKARRVGDSLELVVPVKDGGNVYVQPRFNQLDVVVGGGGSRSGVQAHDNAPQTERTAQTSREAKRANAQDSEQTTARENNRRRQSGAQESETITDGRPQHDAPAMQATERKQATLSAAQRMQGQAPATMQTESALAQQSGTTMPPVNAARTATGTQTAPPLLEPSAPQLPPVEAQANVVNGSSSLKTPLTVLGLCCTGGFVAFMFIYRRQRRAKAEDWDEDADEGTSTALAAAPRALSKTDARAFDTAAPRVSVAGLEPTPHGDRRRDDRRKNLGRRPATN